MGLLLAGCDPVAVDTVGARLLGIDDVEHIKMAANRGLGCNDYGEINVLPTKRLVEQYKLQLHDRGVPLIPSEKIQLVKGKERACRTGCLILGFYFIMFTHGTNYGPCVGVIGKGHDTGQLDKYTGPFVVNGPCAVSELKDYFENRKERDGIRVYYVNDHCNLNTVNKVVRKACGIPLRSLSGLLPVSFPKMISLYLKAKLHGLKCQFF
jgi:hypothetical protein